MERKIIERHDYEHNRIMAKYPEFIPVKILIRTLLGARIKIVTGNLVEISSAMRIEIFNGVKKKIFTAWTSTRFITTA